MVALGSGVTGWTLHAWIRRRQHHRPENPKVPLGSGTMEEKDASYHEKPDPVRSASFRLPESTGLSSQVNSAGRVILHLASLGRLPPEEVAPFGHTQGGMIQALGLRQGTLAKVLSRLEAAHVIEVDLRHVTGQPRRLKVYRLTGVGESVARDLRLRRATSSLHPRPKGITLQPGKETVDRGEEPDSPGNPPSSPVM